MVSWSLTRLRTLAPFLSTGRMLKIKFCGSSVGWRNSTTSFSFSLQVQNVPLHCLSSCSKYWSSISSTVAWRTLALLGRFKIVNGISWRLLCFPQLRHTNCTLSIPQHALKVYNKKRPIWYHDGYDTVHV